MILSHFKSGRTRCCAVTVLFLASVGIIVVYKSQPTNLYDIVSLVQDTSFTTIDDRIPEPLVGLIKSLDELEGRHSDYITEACPGSTSIQQNNQVYPFLGPFKYLSNYKNPCWHSNDAKKLRCVPYFHLIGAPKAGSTDLFQRLNLHPQVHSGRAKETRWFDRLRFNQPGTLDMPTFEHYLNFFQKATREVGLRKRTLNGTSYHPDVLAEGSPTYYYTSHKWRSFPGNEGCTEPRVTVMSYIHHLWPHAKLLMTIRNPTTRMYSAYLFNSQVRGYNGTSAQFHDRITLAHDKWQDCVQEHPFRYCMYDTNLTIKTESMSPSFPAGIYSRYILDLLKIFPRKQIFFVNMEHYSKNKAQYLKEILEFLDLDPLSDGIFNKMANLNQLNKGRHYKKAGDMMEKTRSLLDKFYAPFNRELAAILNDTRYLWLDS